MALITIQSCGSLSANASSIYPNSDSATDELTMPEGFVFYLASITPTWRIYYVNPPFYGSATWSVGPVTPNSRVVRLTVTTNYEASVDVTAEVFGYSIDEASRWGLNSPSLLRRFMGM